MSKGRLLPPAPARAVERGEPRWGRYRGCFSDLNLEELAPRTPLASLRMDWASLRFKEWQHFAIVGAEFYLSLAVVDAKYLCNSFVCHFDRTSGTVVEHSRVGPPARVRIPSDFRDGRLEWATPGYHVVVASHGAISHHLRIDVASAEGRPAITADVTLTPVDADVEPLSSLLPFPSGRPFFSAKGPCAAAGTVSVDGRTYRLDPASDLALVDIHKAMYPWRTFWKWATFAGRTADGRILAVNLTRNVIQPPYDHNENALWVGERLEPLGPVEFTIPDNPMLPWALSTRDGSVQLTFEPKGIRQASVGAGPILSQYQQPFGLFSGLLVDSTGERHAVDKVFGVTENHIARW